MKRSKPFTLSLSFAQTEAYVYSARRCSGGEVVVIVVVVTGDGISKIVR